MFTRKAATISAALAVLTIPAAAAAPSAAAPGWVVDHSQSRLGFDAVANGQAFSGKFGKWDAVILFDPDQLEKSSAQVTIDMNSPDSGDPTRDTTLPEEEWFSTTLFPHATFRTDTIRAGDEAGSYVADGTLTIRNVSKQVSLPFTLAIEDDIAKMQGSLTINRTDFGVGQGAWVSPNSVAFEVKVNVEVTARKAG